MTGLASFNLSGQRALITGAAGLLGREHAAALGELGADVVLTDIGAAPLQALCAELAAAPGGSFRAMVMDVTDPASIAAAARAAGPVDILINNAAIDPKVTATGGLELSRLENFPLAEWHRQMEVGLTGAFLCAQAFGTAMAARGGGVILNIASDLSVIAPDQRLYQRPDAAPGAQPVKPVTYSVIKTALLGLTRYLAGYWAADNVRVNAISPGGVYNGQPEAFVQRLSALIPMGRMAGRDEYRAAVQFLCSPASSYMTGQNIVIDGGRSIL